MTLIHLIVRKSLYFEILMHFITYLVQLLQIKSYIAFPSLFIFASHSFEVAPTQCSKTSTVVISSTPLFAVLIVGGLTRTYFAQILSEQAFSILTHSENVTYVDGS